MSKAPNAIITKRQKSLAEYASYKIAHSEMIQSGLRTCRQRHGLTQWYCQWLHWARKSKNG